MNFFLKLSFSQPSHKVKGNQEKISLHTSLQVPLSSSRPITVVVPKAEAASEVREPEATAHEGSNLVSLPSPRRPPAKR